MKRRPLRDLTQPPRNPMLDRTENGIRSPHRPAGRSIRMQAPLLALRVVGSMLAGLVLALVLYACVRLS